MSETATTNYQFPLCDDPSMKFVNWRESINGVGGTSALSKIDNAIKNKIEFLDKTLASASWNGAGGKSQDITDTKITSSTDVLISLASTASATQREQARKARLSAVFKAPNSLTITCDGVKPTENLPVVIGIIH